MGLSSSIEERGQAQSKRSRGKSKICELYLYFKQEEMLGNEVGFICLYVFADKL